MVWMHQNPNSPHMMNLYDARIHSTVSSVTDKAELPKFKIHKQ